MLKSPPLVATLSDSMRMSPCSWGDIFTWPLMGDRISGLRHGKAQLLAPSRTAGYNSLVPPVSQTIRVTVLFFGRLKDLAGHAEDSAEFSDAATIEQLFALYAARYPELAKYRSSVVASRNQEFAAWD